MIRKYINRLIDERLSKRIDKVISEYQETHWFITTAPITSDNQRVRWCAENCQDEWSISLKIIYEAREQFQFSWDINFENENDAILYKLTFGGTE